MAYLHKYHVDRSIYSYETLNKDYPEVEPHLNIHKAIRKSFQCKEKPYVAFGRKIFPFGFIMASFYKAKFLLNDLIAGITMLVFHIPQGLAYGSLAGLQPIHGLYASLFPPLVYMFFGTSRHISIGTFSLISLLSSEPLSIIVSRNNTGINETILNEQKLQLSLAVTILTGFIQVLMGLLNMGFIMTLLSDALIDGFTSAAAFHVLMTQIEHLFGYRVDKYTGVGQLPYKLFLILKDIAKINPGTIITSLICIGILVLFSEYLNPIIKKKIKFPFPIQFVLVVFGTLISYLANLNGNFNINIVGSIPKGIPAPIFPDIKLWPQIWESSLLLAVIGFVMNGALCKVFALKFAYNIDFNQELVAYGLSNVVGACFKSTMSAAALARTSVVVEVGMKSQVASLISCFVMVFVLMFIGPLFESVPKCVLASIIAVSLRGLFRQLSCLPNLWHISRYDFFTWIVTFLCVLFLTIPYGLGIGFTFSILTIILRLRMPKSQVLGQVPNTDIYKNVKIFKQVREFPGIKVVRYDAPLFFGNADDFRSSIYRKTTINPHNYYEESALIAVKTDVVRRISAGSKKETIQLSSMNSEKMEPLKYVILDCSATNFIDNVGVRILDDLYCSYRQIGINVFLTNANVYIRHMLRKSNFAQENLNRILFVTVHDAVLTALRDMYSEEQKHLDQIRQDVIEEETEIDINVVPNNTYIQPATSSSSIDSNTNINPEPAADNLIIAQESKEKKDD